VYLVPATGHRGGAAVIVPASGPVDTIALPELVAGPDSPARRHATATAVARDAGAVPGSEARAGAIDRLCRWAWSAAMGEVIRYVRRRQPDRPARLVLVPMGMLALVPWHAAYTGDGARRRYAVQDAVISYSVSARMLCAAARHPLRPIRSALVVGDPEGNLPFAGLEAHAIHQRFHPGGSYFGRHATAATPTGTPGQVLDWIAAAAPGPSLLHFACHGVVDPRRPADAHLVLAGGTLTARRLLEASRLAALAIDQVFLAACTTSVGGADYDEAFSLATTFLAAGAHTVFGSLWPVPDSHTSLLMYLVHHFFNVDSCAPVDALHRAQLWMLDPGRRPPDGMPGALARLCADPGAADPVSWAGFTHLGR
jgi:CHAT domain-containing protein